VFIIFLRSQSLQKDKKKHTKDISDNRSLFKASYMPQEDEKTRLLDWRGIGRKTILF
jgi:hypothetical protein